MFVFVCLFMYFFFFSGPRLKPFGPGLFFFLFLSSSFLFFFSQPFGSGLYFVFVFCFFFFFSRPRLQPLGPGLSDRLSFTGQDCQTDSVSLLSATPPIFLVRAVRLSVPYLGHASNVTGQDCQTDSVFLFSATPPTFQARTELLLLFFSYSATPPIFLVRAVRLSVPSLSHASSFTGQDCQTDSVLRFSVTLPTFPARTVFCCSFFPFSATPLALPVRTVRLSVHPLSHAPTFTGQDCQI